jgi:hypothetical protein
MRPDLFLGGLLHHAVEHAAGVVDDDVRPPEGVRRASHRVEHGTPVGDVEREREERVGVPLPQLVQGFGVAGGGHDTVAGREGGLGEGPAQAAGGAGDGEGAGPLRATAEEFSDPAFDRLIRALTTEIANDAAPAAEYREKLAEPLDEAKKARLRSAQAAGRLSPDAGLRAFAPNRKHMPR